MFDKVEFAMLPDGRVLDLRPMYSNSPALIFERGNWIVYDGSVSEMLESKPIQREMIKEITSNQQTLH